MEDIILKSELTKILEKHKKWLNSEDGGELATVDDYEYILSCNGLEIQKNITKPILTEDEKVILRNLPKEYKWIARDINGILEVHEDKPIHGGSTLVSEGKYFNINCFSHLFKFIIFDYKCKQPYNIEELLKE